MKMIEDDILIARFIKEDDQAMEINKNEISHTEKLNYKLHIIMPKCNIQNICQTVYNSSYNTHSSTNVLLRNILVKRKYY